MQACKWAVPLAHSSQRTGLIVPQTALMSITSSALPSASTSPHTAAMPSVLLVSRASVPTAAVRCRSDSIDDCVADCAIHSSCGCAFFREGDGPEVTRRGWCSLTTADCSDAVVGAQVDYTRTRTAISKCSYSASAQVMAGWPDEPYDGIDWFAVWEDVCTHPEPFTYQRKNTFCGPACVVPGTHTTMCAPQLSCHVV